MDLKSVLLVGHRKKVTLCSHTKKNIVASHARMYHFEFNSVFTSFYFILAVALSVLGTAINYIGQRGLWLGGVFEKRGTASWSLVFPGPPWSGVAAPVGVPAMVKGFTPPPLRKRSRHCDSIKIRF